MTKRKLLSTVMIFIVVLSIMICNSLSVSAATNKINDDTIDEYLQTCVKNAHIPALSVTIVDNSIIIADKGDKIKSKLVDKSVERFSFQFFP